MSHDLIIRGGLIVDGTGSQPYPGDIAIDGDTIVAIGNVEGSGARELDAKGHAVTPGFVDLHTHLDAQAGWDPDLTPIVWHGVTTALIGNCGVTFAPCKPEDREYLAGMMESVEDIPSSVILNGLPWDWNSYGEYLDSLDKLTPAINLVGMVGHCAIRTYVMGKRGVDEEPTADEIAQMAALAGKSVAEGAIGFSTSRLVAHKMPDGRSIPGTFAKTPEMVAIAKAVGENNGLVQNVLEYSRLDSEMALLREQALAAQTRVIFTAPHIPGGPGKANAYQDIIDSMRAEGIDITGLALPRSFGFLSGLKTNIMFMSPAWRELISLDFSARLTAIQDADTRANLIREASEMGEDGTPPLDMWVSNFYYLGDSESPEYTKGADESLPAIAAAAGEHPAETWLRIMLETNGEALFHVRFGNHDYEAMEDFLQNDWILPSLGDTGAHLTQIIDAGWSTFMLSHWHREKGTFTLEETIRLLTSAQARILGFKDRGSLAVGMRADINIIDVDQVTEGQPTLIRDFPNDTPRLSQKAKGYLATICNGNIIVENGELTGQRSGRVLRNQPNSAA
ncbi:MAG: amidohydrolase family protein [Pseudomonadales bacterium]|jgi:N-acyl-D-aspartate/D-glutamate deacylase|nr:amidohydrolase family protein [Pseudomonadales bacterium]MDG1303564.1 amidohydrolase family protein [Pseudomonadales bacterium]